MTHYHECLPGSRVYYGWLISLRPVIVCNVIAVLVNSGALGAIFISSAQKKPKSELGD